MRRCRWSRLWGGHLLKACFATPRSLVQDYGPRTVFGITAGLPLIIATSSLLIDETPVQKRGSSVVSGSKGDPAGSRRGEQQAAAAARACHGQSFDRMTRRHSDSLLQVAATRQPRCLAAAAGTDGWTGCDRARSARGVCC